MAILREVDRFIVPSSMVSEIWRHLRDAGRHRCEGVGFWAGVIQDRTAEVRAVFVPGQTTGHFDNGLAVVISGEELFRMNVALHQHGLTLFAQIHSHPGAAYHSSTDDELSVVTQIGSLSLVVPNFANEPFSLESVAAYRLSDAGTWDQVDHSRLKALIQILDV